MKVLSALVGLALLTNVYTQANPDGTMKCGFRTCAVNSECLRPHKCGCKPGFHGDPYIHCAEGCVCVGAGDPHFKTFDGMSIPFMGSCMYLMSRTIWEDEPNPECDFVVLVKNEFRYGSTQVTYVRLVELHTMGVVVRINQGKNVTVDSLRYTLPFSYDEGKLKVFYSGRHVVAENSCGVKLMFDGVQESVLIVPKNIADGLTGLCGDCNDIKDDYKTSNGTDVSNLNYALRYATIGDSYKVPDTSDQPYSNCDTPGTRVECSTDRGKEYVDKYCGFIKGSESPFSYFFDNSNADIDIAFRACEIDICAYENHQDGILDDIGCMALAKMMDEANLEGYSRPWRTPDMCFLGCPENMNFNDSMTACPETCADTNGAPACDLPDTEGCECDDSLILSGLNCVTKEECGCTDSYGDYRAVDEEWVSNDCEVMFKCTHDRDGKKEITTTELGICHGDAICRIKFGKRKCVCNGNLIGDGITECKAPHEPGVTCGSRNRRCHHLANCVDGRCVCPDGMHGDGKFYCGEDCNCIAYGDPHYYTYDNQIIHFMGRCKYTLTQSLPIADVCGFNIEVKNENRNNITKVSYTRMVDVKVLGRTIRLLQGRKVLVDGQEYDLPISDIHDDLDIFLSGRFVQLETKCGVRVAWDGDHSVMVLVPKRYSNNMTGICGNCNGDKDDDFVGKNGTNFGDLTAPGAKYTKLGASFRVPDDSDQPYMDDSTCEPEVTMECNPQLRNRIKHDKYCGLIKNTEGSFADCLVNGSIDFNAVYDSCEMDVCAFDGRVRDVRPVVCRALEAFAEECESAGFSSLWRSRRFCPMDCARRERYNPHMSGCPMTCLNSKSEEMCSEPEREGCECRRGYLRAGLECIRRRECQCRYQVGERLVRMKVNQTTLTDLCREEVTCLVGAHKHEVKITNKNFTCPPEHRCMPSMRGSWCKPDPQPLPKITKSCTCFYSYKGVDYEKRSDVIKKRRDDRKAQREAVRAAYRRRG